MQSIYSYLLSLQEIEYDPRLFLNIANCLLMRLVFYSVEHTGDSGHTMLNYESVNNMGENA